MSIDAVAGNTLDQIQSRLPVLSNLAAQSLQKTLGNDASGGVQPTLNHPVLAQGLDTLAYGLHQALIDHAAGTSSAPATGSSRPVLDAITQQVANHVRDLVSDHA